MSLVVALVQIFSPLFKTRLQDIKNLLNLIDVAIANSVGFLFNLAHKQLAFCSSRKISHLDSLVGFDQLAVERRQCNRHSQGFLPDQRTSQVGGVIAPEVMLYSQEVASRHRIFGDRQALKALPFRAELAQGIEEWVIGWYRVSKFHQAFTDDNLSPPRTS